MFPDFLTPVLTQPFFPKPPTTFITCFCRGERRKYSGKKVRLNRGSNSQPPGHVSDTLQPNLKLVPVVSLSTTEIAEITRFKKKTDLQGMNTLDRSKFQIIADDRQFERGLDDGARPFFVRINRKQCGNGRKW